MYPKPIRIAMWSGPRNISTAMMRSWENRPDTVVLDEPFYAHYLLATGIDHPGRQEVIAAQETDWRAVARQLSEDPLPPGKTISYQKHMTHHLLDTMDVDWIDGLHNCFLIRAPQEVIASYIKVRPEVTLADLGLREQRRIFDHVRRRTGDVPPVLDSGDVLANPRGMLSLLCSRLGIAFDERMLQWPAGPRPSDGVWAKYWYSAVWASTGFGPARARVEAVPQHLHKLLDEANDLYAELYNHRLTLKA